MDRAKDVVFFFKDQVEKKKTFSNTTTQAQLDDRSSPFARRKGDLPNDGSFGHAEALDGSSFREKLWSSLFWSCLVLFWSCLNGLVLELFGVV